MHWKRRLTHDSDEVDRMNPFRGEGEWLKAALHTHSTVSDGTLAPDRLVQSYVEAGFDIVAITDHWRLTQPNARDDVILVPGAELGFDMIAPAYPRQSAEFLVYGLTDIPEDPGGDRSNWYFSDEDNYEVRTFPSLSEGTKWATGQGAVTYVAHPYWNQLPPHELMAMEGYTGIEVFNGSAELECGRGDSSPWWDLLLGEGREVFGIATDDQHYPLFELGTAWTMLNVAERSPAAVLDALRTGASYFSHGPSIYDVSDQDGGMEITCSPVRSIRLQTEEEFGACVTVGRAGRRMGQILETDGRGLITRAFVEGAAERRYRRVVIVDEHGNRAWSNPL